MDNEKTLLKQVFGDSSESEDNNEQQEQEEIENSVCDSTVGDNPTWEPIKEIKGLWLCRDFLSSHQQCTLLSSIQNGAFRVLNAFHILFI